MTIHLLMHRRLATWVGRLLFLCLLSTFASCSSTQIAGTYSSKTYVSPDGEFSVAPPPFPELEIKDTVFPDQIFVDFSLRRGYWTPFGLYTVEWLKLVRPMTREDFSSVSPEFIAQNVESRFRGKNASFKIVDQIAMPNAQRPAYRALAIGKAEGVEAYYLVTMLYFETRIAFVSVLAAPARMVGGGAMPDRLPIRNDWYEPMMNSLIRLK